MFIYIDKILLEFSLYTGHLSILLFTEQTRNLAEESVKATSNRKKLF